MDIPSLLLALLLGLGDYPRDLGNVERWSQAIRAYAETCPPARRAVLEQIVADAAAMAPLDIHKAYDALEATVTHLDEVRSPIANFGAVEPGRLLRGAQPSRAGLRWLARQGVGTVIVLREAEREETNYPGWSRADYLREARQLGLAVVELPIRDTTGPTPAQLDLFLRKVDGADKPCFMHCSAGIGRTGVLAGLYLRHRGASAEEALRHAQAFMLNPGEKPDHAVQAAFLQSYPVHDADPEPGDALFPARFAGPPLLLETPDFRALADALGNGRPVTFVFTPENLDVMGALSSALPPGARRGRARGLNAEQRERVRLWLGSVAVLED